MRTTIELTDEQRARLLQIAANRGEKGFSRLVQEAIDLYLEGQSRRGDAIQRALAVQGKLLERDADALEERVSSIRKEWR